VREREILLVGYPKGPKEREGSLRLTGAGLGVVGEGDPPAPPRLS